MQSKLFKGVKITPISYYDPEGFWLSRVMMQRADGSGNAITAAASPQTYRSELEANTAALDWAKHQVLHDTWC